MAPFGLFKILVSAMSSTLSFLDFPHAKRAIGPCLLVGVGATIHRRGVSSLDGR